MGDRGCQNACTFRSLGEVYYKTWEILWSFTNQLNTSCCDSTSKHLLGTSEFCKPRKCGSESLHQSLKWGRMWVVLIYAGQHGELMTPIFLLTTDFTSGLKHGILVFCIWACLSCMGKKMQGGNPSVDSLFGLLLLFHSPNWNSPYLKDVEQCNTVRVIWLFMYLNELRIRIWK